MKNITKYSNFAVKCFNKFMSLKKHKNWMILVIFSANIKKGKRNRILN